MNIYDVKPICCSTCGKFIGEIACDAIVIFPKCGKCTNLLQEWDDSIAYLVNKTLNNMRDNETVFAN